MIISTKYSRTIETKFGNCIIFMKDKNTIKIKVDNISIIKRIVNNDFDSIEFSVNIENIEKNIKFAIDNNLKEVEYKYFKDTDDEFE